MLSDHINYSCLLWRLDINVVVRVLNANVFVPVDQGEGPFVTIPAPFTILSLIELPLCDTWLLNFVTEDAGNLETALVCAQHRNLLLVYYLGTFSQFLDLSRLLHEPHSEVLDFVISDLDFVLSHVELLNCIKRFL